MSVTHVLDFVCKHYTGNFEREFVSYVFATESWEDSGRDYSKYIPEASRASLTARLEDLLDSWPSEYGYVRQDIERVTFDGGEAWAVRVRVSDGRWKQNVTSELIEELKARASQFFPIFREHERFSETTDDSFLGILHHTVTTVESDSTKL